MQTARKSAQPTRTRPPKLTWAGRVVAKSGDGTQTETQTTLDWSPTIDCRAAPDSIDDSRGTREAPTGRSGQRHIARLRDVPSPPTARVREPEGIGTGWTHSSPGHLAALTAPALLHLFDSALNLTHQDRHAEG